MKQENINQNSNKNQDLNQNPNNNNLHQKLQPSYYAILPANIRYDKNLNSTEKLLYAEITALSDREGYCWASNGYFAELLDLRSDYISKVIKKLEDKDYIRVDITRNQSGTFRKVYIGLAIDNNPTSEKSPTGVVKNHEGGSDLMQKGSCFSAIQNNTINNTIKNNIKEYKEIEIDKSISTKREKENSKPSKKQTLQNDPNFHSFLEIANRIKQLIETQKRISITNIQVANWAKEINKLYKTLESARGSENAIESMFLMINTLNADIGYGDKYKPVIESGKSFREKFIKIEDYYRRRQMQHNKQQQEDDFII